MRTGRLRDGLVLAALILYATPFFWQALTSVLALTLLYAALMVVEVRLMLKANQEPRFEVELPSMARDRAPQAGHGPFHIRRRLNGLKAAWRAADPWQA